MAKTAQIKATTQRFTEVTAISDFVVLFQGGYACSIIEISATNFALQSQGEQEAKILSYASFLNSLSFSIQILIRSQKLDISAYLKLLDEDANRAQNVNFSTYIKNYRNFVADLVKSNTVLDKRFYIVIPYSPLEKGVKGAGTITSKNKSEVSLDEARSVLRSKNETVLAEIGRTGLKATVLNKDELTALFYDVYNDGESIKERGNQMGSAMVLGKGGAK